MYSNIVVGVDGRGGGRDAAALGALLAEPKAELALVNVCITDPLPSRASSPAFELATDEEARELLAQERELCGRPFETLRVAATSVGGGLEQIAVGRAADLIVVGSCHRGVVGRVLAGDDATSVLHHAHRSVAIAPAGYRAERPQLQSIGVAYNGWAESEVALSYAESVAKARGAGVIAHCVVAPHVMAAPTGAGGSYMEDPEALIAHARAELRTLENAQLDIVVGSPGLSLTAFSEQVDVLVCGSRHNRLVRRLILGSTSGYLARHARCPLIVTPAPTARADSAAEAQASTADL